MSTTQTTAEFAFKDRAQQPINEEPIHHLDEPTKPEFKSNVFAVKSKAPPPPPAPEPPIVKQNSAVKER